MPRSSRHIAILTGLLIMINTASAATPPPPATSANARALFKSPTRDYSSGPLWVWNDLLTEEQIISTINDMAAQNVKQVFIHPRPGMMTEYLSDDWFRLWKVALKEAEKLDMNVWIYDENSYPSGFAGGRVPEEMPDSAIRMLHLPESDSPPTSTAKTLAIYKRTGNQVTFATADDKPASGTIFIAANIEGKPPSPWYGGKTYVDLLMPGVTEKFLELTMEPYKKHLSEHFGKRIPGLFSDEANIHEGGVTWTRDMLAEFQKRWEYDLLPHLPSLSTPVGDWKKVRYQFSQLQNELFIERWGKTCYEYCDALNLEYTGHYWDHAWPSTSGVPDNMAMYAWQHRPGIDQLMNQYSLDVRAQFGNARMVREVSSVANQLGRKRTLCETYGAGGWDLRFEDQKRIADWLAVLGINTFNQHLSYVTLRGARKRDHPQSFSYHTPWWPHYHVLADYLARLSVAMSAGKQVNKILVLQPTTTAYMYQHKFEPPDALDKLGNAFQDIIHRLEKDQVEYDIGSEYIMKEHGSVTGAELTVGERSYHTIVITPHTETLNESTVKLLEQFVRAGGKVLSCGDAPPLLEGEPSNRVAALSKLDSWQKTEVDALASALTKLSDSNFSINRSEGDQGFLFHQRRQLDDGELLFLVNTGIDTGSSGTVNCAAANIEIWNLETGEPEQASFEKKGGGSSMAFELPPCGSLLLFLSKGTVPSTNASRDSENWTAVAPSAPAKITRLQPNVLVLDTVALKAGDTNTTSTYFHKAQQLAFVANGMERNPWDSAVQRRDEFISRKFPPDSGFSATYTFTIKDEVPTSLSIVIERPDLYSITCNDKPVTATADAWWMDKAFLQIDLREIAKVGENRVTIKAQPFNVWHEIEPAFVLGNFNLETSASGFLITKETELKHGPWDKQGLPFYGEAVSYKQTFNHKPGQPARVKLNKWLGGVAEVRVNDQSAGIIGWAPWTLDISSHLKPGINEVEVVVIGTPRNPLGPHHGDKIRGTAWPGMFKNGPDTPPPGEKYDVIGYGLFEPFTIEVAR